MTVNLPKQTILIVEDQAGPREALMMILGSLYLVYTAETAAAALKILVDRPIDLVITDVGLPDCSGIELLRRVRAGGQDVKVIVMSGGGSLETAQEVFRLGAVAYLLKPFNFRELHTLISDALKGKSANSA
jgi:putative two-component system response regulator